MPPQAGVPPVAPPAVPIKPAAAPVAAPTPPAKPVPAPVSPAPRAPVADPPRRSRWPLVVGALVVGLLAMLTCGGVIAAGGLTAVVVAAPDLQTPAAPKPGPSPTPRPKRPRR